MHFLDSIRALWFPPALAFGVALIGRFVLRGPLAPAGTAVALVCGWLPLFGPLRAVALVWSPHLPAEGLMLATLAGTAGLMASQRVLHRVTPVLLAALAIGAAWWLTGAHPLSTVLADQVVRVGFLAVLLWAGMRALLTAAPWPACVAALSLGLALLAANAGGVWPMLGFVVAAVTAARFGEPALGGAVRKVSGGSLGSVAAGGALLPAGLGLGGVAGMAVLLIGRLPHGGIGAADVAGAAPLVALWLPGPLRRLGPRFGPPVSGLLMIFAAFLTRRIING
jgi:hypothetical protein